MVEVLERALSSFRRGDAERDLLSEETALLLLRCGSAVVARQYGVSERTLRRRFEKIGSRLEWHCAERRRNIALRLLAEGLPNEVIAARLGLSSASSFCRFAKREIRESPKDLRLRLSS